MAGSFSRWFRGLVASDSDSFPPPPLADDNRYAPSSFPPPNTSSSSNTTTNPSTGFSSTVNPATTMTGTGAGGIQHRHHHHHQQQQQQQLGGNNSSSSYSSSSSSAVMYSSQSAFSASVQDDLESIGLLREASTSAAPTTVSSSASDDKQQTKKKGASRCDINLALFGLEDSGKSTLIKHIAVIQQQLRGPRKKDDRTTSTAVPSSMGNSALLLYKNDIVEYLLRCIKEVALSALVRQIQMSDDHNNQLLTYFATSDPSEIDLAAAAPTHLKGKTTDVGAQIATLWNDARLRQFFVHYWKYSPLSTVSSQTTGQDTEMKVKSCPDLDAPPPEALVPAPPWPCNSEFFLDSAQRIMHRDYVPTMQDVLFCKTEMAFNGQDDLEVDYNGLNFRIIDVGQRSETRTLDHLIAIAVVVPLDDYDMTREFHGIPTNAIHTFAGSSSSGDTSNQTPSRLSNRLLLTYQLFDEVCNSNWGIELPIILILNKADRFARKIQQRDLSVCFPDYKDGKNYTAAIKYIVTRFARQNRNKHRSIYYNVTSAISPQDVTSTLIALFNCLREIILYNNLRDTNII